MENVTTSCAQSDYTTKTSSLTNTPISTTRAIHIYNKDAALAHLIDQYCKRRRKNKHAKHHVLTLHEIDLINGAWHNSAKSIYNNTQLGYEIRHLLGSLDTHRHLLTNYLIPFEMLYFSFGTFKYWLNRILINHTERNLLVKVLQKCLGTTLSKVCIENLLNEFWNCWLQALYFWALFNQGINTLTHNAFNIHMLNNKIKLTDLHGMQQLLTTMNNIYYGCVTYHIKPELYYATNYYRQMYYNYITQLRYHPVCEYLSLYLLLQMLIPDL